MRHALSAALHRLGIVGGLRTHWQRDIHAVEDRVTAEARKAFEPRWREVRDDQSSQGVRLKSAQARLEELQGQVAALESTCRTLERKPRALEAVVAGARRDASRLRQWREGTESRGLARHVAAAIAAAPLVDDPAPMLIVEDLFPRDMYDAIVAGIPPADVFAHKDPTKLDFRIHGRGQTLPDLADAVWSHMDADLIPGTIVPSLRERFAPFIGPYYQKIFGDDLGAEMGAMPLEATAARLMLRKPGYHLRPHLDPRRVFATGLVYFARPGDDEDYGTAFYRVDGAVVRNDTGTYFPQLNGHRCDLVRKVRFRANTAVFFLNAAAHGVEILATAPPDLERYALQFYLGVPVGLLQERLRRLPEAERQTWAELLE